MRLSLFSADCAIMLPHMDQTPLHSHTIIAGFGIPGRAAADVLIGRELPFVVIERNSEVSSRCERAGVPILSGDVLNESTLDKAGIARASLFVMAIPDDAVCLQAVQLVRRLNPTIRIIARCVFTSAGMQAMAHGADETIIAEQVVARDLAKAVEERLPEKK
jgi:voltage-gated potassium channel Kch